MYRIFKITAHTTIAFSAGELKKYLRMMMPRCGEIPVKYAPVIKENKKQYYRASSVAWQLLEVFNDMVDLLATATENKCVGNHKEAPGALDTLFLMMSEKEIYIERYYDQFLFCRTWEEMAQRKQVVINSTNI